MCINISFTLQVPHLSVSVYFGKSKLDVAPVMVVVL